MPRMYTSEDCPKCGASTGFCEQYLAKGAVKLYKDVGDNPSMSSKVARGPCLMRWCPNCSYTYTRPPADGEGTEKSDGNA